MFYRHSSAALSTLAALLITCSIPSWGEAPKGRVTFNKDILPILQENCQTCHRPLGKNLAGMVAPMSLMTYEEARPWAKSMARAVNEKSMPPWHASEKTHGTFRNERTLSQDEIDTIVAWVNQRAQRGNPSDAPTPIEFSETGWNFGNPDLVVGFDEPYLVRDEIEDLYHNITVTISEDQLPTDKWIRAIEYKPGSEVVHHIIGNAITPDQDPEAGSGLLGGMAPGSDPQDWPEGFGMKLQTGSNLTFAMHYHKESGPGTAKWDSSAIGFQFHDKPAQHPVTFTNVAHGLFEIPPGHERWKVGASRTFEEDTYLLSLMPHLHLRGAEAIYTAYYPDGSVEELMHIPEYDFNWQTFYKFADPKVLPAGTRIEMEFWYNNSKEKAEAIGFNDKKAVRFGGPTTDEMDIAWIEIAPVAPTASD